MKKLSKVLLCLTLLGSMVQASWVSSLVGKFHENNHELYDMQTIQEKQKINKKNYDNVVAQCNYLVKLWRHPVYQRNVMRAVFGLIWAIAATESLKFARALFLVVLVCDSLLNRLILMYQCVPLALKDYDLEAYEIGQQLQKELDLQNVSIEFLSGDLRRFGNNCKGLMVTQNALFATLPERFLVISGLAPKNSNYFKKFILRHELAHVQQALSRSEGIGLRPSLHKEGTIILPDHKLDQRLKEQAADAAAYGDFSCSSCLFDISQGRVDYDSSQMTPGDYCVSSEGYLSQEEILEYAKAREIDGHLCELHSKI